jgi:hypothetical protein
MERQFVILTIAVCIVVLLIGAYFIGTSSSNPISGAMTGFATAEENSPYNGDTPVLIRKVIPT